MEFEWDAQKNEANIVKHEFDFTDAFRIFDGPMLTRLDDRFEYDEERWVGLGSIYGRVVVVIYTEPNEENIRIISLRKALPHERKSYELYLQNELG